MTNLLYIQFDNNSACVGCADIVLHQMVARHFRHSLGKKSTVIVTYEFTVKNGNWQLLRNSLLLFIESSRIRILERFLQDVTIMFIRHAQSSLCFHAAGIVSGLQGFILCGQSGSGKSTLAAWLIASGFDFLTDELVAISADGSKICGFARPLVLKRGSEFVWQRWLSTQNQNSLIHVSNNNVWLDPEDLRPECIRTTASPSIVLYPRYIEGNSLEVRPLSAAESAFRLMHHLVNIDHLSTSGLPAITNLSRHTTAYDVSFGDVVQVATWVQQFV